MKKINLNKILGAEILNYKDLKLILGGDEDDDGPDLFGGSKVNPCAEDKLCGSNCMTRSGAGTKCAYKPRTTTCTCGGF